MIKTISMKKNIALCIGMLLFTAIMATPDSFDAGNKRHPLPGTASFIDTDLRITYPLIGKKVRGYIVIKGKAKAGSFVTITVSSTYYKLGVDQQKRKILKGEGPLKSEARTVRIKTNGQGFWSTNAFNFRNQGWSEEFKIVAKSVEGKNATYVTVTDDTKPAIAWD